MRRLLRLLSLGLFVLLCLALFPPVQAASFWSQTYGEAGFEKAFAIVKAADGGYAVAGITNSFGAGSYDFWLLKIDADGNVQWNRTYGSERNEAAFSLAATPDGGYILAGAIDFDFVSWMENSYLPLYFNRAGVDTWIVKTDASGNMQWNKTFVGDNYNVARGIVATSDSGYAFCGTKGYCNEVGGGISGHGEAWLIKLDTTGNIMWNRTFGSSNLSYFENAFSLVQTADDGYAVAGNMMIEAQTSGYLPASWLLKTDASGVVQWNKTYGTGVAYALINTADGGYALTGLAGLDYNCSLVKTDSDGNIQWSRVYTGEYNYADAIIKTSDGGYALAGHWNSGSLMGVIFDSSGRVYDDAYLVKTDGLGNLLWGKVYGQTGSGHLDGLYGIVEAQDGGYVLAGCTSNDLWLLKTDELGVVPESVPTTNITANIANPTQQPTSTPTSTALPSPSPPIPELSLLVIIPSMLSLLSAALILRHRKQFKKP